MIHLAIFASLAACLCFGAVLFGQIRRIDSIEERLNYSFSQLDDRLLMLINNQEIDLRDMSKLDKRLKQLEQNYRGSFFVGGPIAAPGGGGCVCSPVAHGTNGRPPAQFSPGEPHPFAADAYVSSDEVLA